MTLVRSDHPRRARRMCRADRAPVTHRIPSRRRLAPVADGCGHRRLRRPGLGTRGPCVR
jgi:hypothetical protein